MFLPGRKRCALSAGLKRDSAHHGETIGVLACGFRSVVVAVAVERRRNQYRAIDTDLIHRSEQGFVSVRWAVAIFLVEAPARTVRRPNMDLRIEDTHVYTRSSGCRNDGL